ncbi:hypothetical protein B0E37_05299 [Streptomyces sp. MH192]|nr:hypothetical protein [Streptomyces sp. MH192]MCF0102411.1 hypothetical protein [Streptomyces sp. MH191]
MSVVDRDESRSTRSGPGRHPDPAASVPRCLPSGAVSSAPARSASGARRQAVTDSFGTAAEAPDVSGSPSASCAPCLRRPLRTITEAALTHTPAARATR